jgi:hypothetical protein
VVLAACRQHHHEVVCIVETGCFVSTLHTCPCPLHPRPMKHV